MKTLRNTTAFFLLLLFWTYNLYADSANATDRELFTELGQVNVRVLITSLPESQSCKAASSWRWGAENACPRNIISALEINISGESAFVPLSAFADLGNPRTVKIESRRGKGQFAVVLTGGDAATSYSVMLEFRGNLLSERVVRHGEFPEQSWEKTIYKFNIGNRRK